MPVRSGLESLVADHLRADSVIAVAGEDAATLAEQFARSGGPPLAVEADRFALLSDELDPPLVGRLRDLPPGAADLVILRRAWNSPTDVAEAVVVGRRAVRPGGEVVVSDVDVDRLLSGPSPRYPVRLLYEHEPEAADRLERTTAPPALLGMAMVRARFHATRGFGYDEVRGDYADAAAMWRGVQSRGWRGSAWVHPDALGPLFEAVAPALAKAVPGDRAIDREPWYAVSGRVG